MGKKSRPQILLTNDDGIDSPGLLAAAESLSEIGYVWVVAPREQSTGAGRSLPASSDGIISPKKILVKDTDWTVYAVGGTPAQAVQHGILEIMPIWPDLVVAGINYGLNLATGITISGTVGAAMESASHGIPSIAVSLDTPKQYHLSQSTDISFDEAAKITKFFATQILKSRPSNYDLLKIDIPEKATGNSEWEITSLSPYRYYRPTKPDRESWAEPGTTGYVISEDLEKFPENSDVYTVLAKNKVSVTPISLDMTAKIDFKELKEKLSN